MVIKGGRDARNFLEKAAFQKWQLLGSGEQTQVKSPEADCATYTNMNQWQRKIQDGRKGVKFTL